MSKRLEVIERTLQAGSKDPFVWYARAMELRSLGRLEDAAQAFTEVAEKFPDYVPTYLMAAQVTCPDSPDHELLETDGLVVVA